MGWLNLEAMGSAEGILLMWKENCMEVVDSVLGVFSITIKCKFHGQARGWITRVYSPCAANDRKIFLQELYDLAGLCQGSWCVVGDFNVV